jgi:hypothetical protein
MRNTRSVYTERKGTLQTYNQEHTSKTQDGRTTKKKIHMKRKNIKNESNRSKLHLIVNYIWLVRSA